MWGQCGGDILSCPKKPTLGATRTPDTLLRTEVFYPTELRGQRDRNRSFSLALSLTLEFWLLQLLRTFCPKYPQAANHHGHNGLLHEQTPVID